MKTTELEKYTKKLKRLKEKSLVLKMKEILPKGKYIGYPDYIHINEKEKAVRVSEASPRWANNAKKVFKELGYNLNLDTRKKGSIML